MRCRNRPNSLPLHRWNTQCDRLELFLPQLGAGGGITLTHTAVTYCNHRALNEPGCPPSPWLRSLYLAVTALDVCTRVCCCTSPKWSDLKGRWRAGFVWLKGNLPTSCILEIKGVHTATCGVCQVCVCVLMMQLICFMAALKHLHWLVFCSFLFQFAHFLLCVSLYRDQWKDANKWKTQPTKRDERNGEIQVPQQHELKKPHQTKRKQKLCEGD